MYKAPNLGQVLTASNQMKGWDTLPEPGTTIWIIKNINGKYYTPYSVDVLATYEQGSSKASLVYVDTHIEGYYDHVSSTFDIIGKSKEEVEHRVVEILSANKRREDSFKRALENVQKKLAKST